MTPDEFSRLQGDPKAAESFFGMSLQEPEKLLARTHERESGDCYLSIGTDWHALHFLLTGDGELKPHPLPPPPLGNIVQGGTEAPWPCTYGQVRSLSPEEVRAAADALNRISVEELRSRFSVTTFNSAKIYPHGKRGQWSEEDAESVFDIYPRVVEFFQAGARDGDVILISSD
jgi:hypothetical protein